MYGQVVIGAPGAGKSTYCSGITQILRSLKRPVICVNLDPANENIPYECDVDIRDLITVHDVMERLKLGPNGALRFCMETLVSNADWLKESISEHQGFLIIDCPGQLELYNHEDCIAKLLAKMQRWGHRLVAVHLSDCLYCTDPGKYVSLVINALSIMINLEISQVNVLSKIDLIDDNLPYQLHFFQNLPNARRIIDLLDESGVLQKYKRLNASICSVIDDYSLVAFSCIDVNDKSSMLSLLDTLDKANGYSLVEAGDLRNVLMK